MSAGFYTGDDYDSIPYVTPGDISNHITWWTSCFLLLFVAISFVSLAGWECMGQMDMPQGELLETRLRWPLDLNLLLCLQLWDWSPGSIYRMYRKSSIWYIISLWRHLPTPITWPWFNLACPFSGKPQRVSAHLSWV